MPKKRRNLAWDDGNQWVVRADTPPGFNPARCYLAFCARRHAERLVGGVRATDFRCLVPSRPVFGDAGAVGHLGSHGRDGGAVHFLPHAPSLKQLRATLHSITRLSCLCGIQRGCVPHATRKVCLHDARCPCHRAYVPCGCLGACCVVAAFLLRLYLFVYQRRARAIYDALVRRRDARCVGPVLRGPYRSLWLCSPQSHPNESDARQPVRRRTSVGRAVCIVSGAHPRGIRAERQLGAID